MVKVFLVFILLFFHIYQLNPCEIFAQIETDGTVGVRTSLKGPDYKISADLGRISGKNLFHSFREFNVYKNDVVTFTGPDTVENIISRVTGDKSSIIDGKIVSAIKGADFYFINPNGVIFGENAQIDVGGSFYVSTADYLRFSDGGRFYSKNLTESSFSVASPEAFGFLGLNKSAIKIENQTNEKWLKMKPERNIHFSSGNIDINNSIIYLTSGNIHILTMDKKDEILINRLNRHNNYSGIINMNNSIIANDGYGKGEIFIGTGDLILNKTGISSYHKGDYDGSNIYFYVANNLSLKDSYIESISDSNKKAGDIIIYAGNINITDASNIANVSKKGGNAGNIQIYANENFNITGISKDKRSGVWNISRDKGETGNIVINAKNILIDNYGIISNNADKTAKRGYIKLNGNNLTLSGNSIIQGGNIYGELGKVFINKGAYIWSFKNALNPAEREIRLDIKDSLIIIGENQTEAAWRNKTSPLYTGIHTDSFVSSQGNAGDIYINCPYIKITNSGDITARSNYGDGHSGNIYINAQKIELLSGGEIGVDSFGSSNYYSNAGNVYINARDYILISGKNGELYSGFGAGTRSSGDAGKIIINTPNLIISDSANIVVATGVFGQGKAGEIYINVDNLDISNKGGISASSAGYGKEGLISIDAKNKLTIRNNGFIVSWGDRGGSAGSIFINADKILIDNGRISTITYGEKKAGNININSNSLVLINSSKITSQSDLGSLAFINKFGDAGEIKVNSKEIRLNSSAITTGAAYSAGGNIEIDGNTIILRDKSQVTATVYGGEGGGGDVNINANAFVTLEKSSITAKADRGKGGNILVNSLVFLREGEFNEVLNASSNVSGNDGTVLINSPELDISGAISVLSGFFLDASGILSDVCSVKKREKNSSLIFDKCGGISLISNIFYH